VAWRTIDRNEPVIAEDAPAVLDDAVREKIRSFFPRYDTKRAALLPALHVVQDALGQVSWQAMTEVADLLEIHPSCVFDALSFYTHFWTHPRGRKVIVSCRNLSCTLMGGERVLDALKRELGIAEHQTTEDGRYSLVTDECLAACDHAPCLLINEKLHKCVKPDDVPALLADETNDRLDVPRSDLFDAPGRTELTEPVGEPVSTSSGSGEGRQGECSVAE